jgi:competence protein ComK
MKLIEGDDLMSRTKKYRYYVINTYTMMIQPMRYEDKLYSRIFQLDGEFHSPLKPTDIIKMNCLDNASSYEGRVNGSRHILGRYQKVPITINSENQLYFFPTASPDHADCTWINPIHVENIFEKDNKTILVRFHNNQTIEISVSHHIFTNQMHKTMTLQNKVNQKKYENQGRSIFLYKNNVRISERGISSSYDQSLNKNKKPHGKLEEDE